MATTSQNTEPNSDLLPPYAGLARLNTADQEAQGFWRLRARIAGTILRQTLATSRLRVALVVVLSLLFWIGLFAFFHEAFDFLGTYLGPGGVFYTRTVQTIYNVFFFSLMVMLVFSSAIILYSGLYRTGETELLLTLPVRTERIVQYRFQEAVLFSSWGFLLLGSPMLVAYGVVAYAPWYYYVMLVPFMLAFAYIPCAIGAIVCLLVVRWIPKLGLHGMRVAIVSGVVLVIVLAALGTALSSMFQERTNDLLTAGWFEDTIERLKFAEQRLSPSWWLSSGLLEASHRTGPAELRLAWAHSIMFLAVLLTNSMLCHVMVAWVGRRYFRASYSALYGEQTGKRGWISKTIARLAGNRVADWLFGPRPGSDFTADEGSVAWIDRIVLTLARPLDYHVRLLIVKDLQVFRRDPVQWSQFLIFFGLLALYFVNIRRFNYDVNYRGWVNMVSFLNLAVVGLILSTFTTRFIFPMISLEGNRFWILGLLPIERDTILWGKFLFAAIGSIVPCTLLIWLSDAMLQVAPLVMWIHQLTCVILCIGLSAIAVGLGAMMPDLKEQSPSKIAAGFGGTLNLVLSAIYIMAVVMLTALPCHFYVAAADSQLGAIDFEPNTFGLWLAGGAAAAIVLGILATVIPLRMGLKAFRAMEF